MKFLDFDEWQKAKPELIKDFENDLLVAYGKPARFHGVPCLCPPRAKDCPICGGSHLVAFALALRWLAWQEYIYQAKQESRPLTRWAAKVYAAKLDNITADNLPDLGTLPPGWKPAPILKIK